MPIILAASTSPNIWVLLNPYFVALFTGGIILVGWIGRTILKRLSDITATLVTYGTDIAVLKDRQKLTAARVGVPAKSLEDAE